MTLSEAKKRAERLADEMYQFMVSRESSVHVAATAVMQILASVVAQMHTTNKLSFWRTVAKHATHEMVRIQAPEESCRLN